MTFSVILVAYRTPIAMLRSAIEAVNIAAERDGEPAEVVVVDNGGAVRPIDLPAPTRLTGTGVNVGFGVAVKSAVREASGEIVLFLNPDSIVDREFFRQAREAINLSNRPTLFGGLLLNDGRPQALAYNIWWGAFHLKRSRSMWQRRIETIIAGGEAAVVARLCGAALFARRDILLRLGPFDERYFLYGEDVDLSLRARMTGHALSLIPTAIVHHDPGTSSDLEMRLRVRAQTDAHLRLLATWRSPLRSLLGRLEVAVVALAGLISAHPSKRERRLAQAEEVLRWGLSRSAARFDPNALGPSSLTRRGSSAD